MSAVTALVPACLNCGAALAGSYCDDCGQHRAVTRPTLRALVHEMAAQVFELDHGLLHTFVDLLRRPAAMIREYIAGRRRMYTGPIAFVLIACTFSMLRTELTPSAKAYLESSVRNTGGEVAKLFGEQRAATFVREQQLLMGNKFVLAVALLIPFTLAFRLVFRKRGFNLAEMGVFTCYMLAQTTILGVFAEVMLTAAGYGRSETMPFFVISFAYLFYAGTGLFGLSFSTIWRILAAVALGVVLMNVGLLLLPFILVH